MKENANPTIYAVQTKRENDDVSYSATESIRRFNIQNAAEYDSINHLKPKQFLTSVERSIQLATESIENTVKESGGDCKNALGILSTSGMHGSISSEGMEKLKSGRAIHLFQPYDPKQKTIEVKRDPITQQEVFDIIRNIQDPEHPLTLEQLNVVNCDHVTVIDNHPDLKKQSMDNEEDDQDAKHSHSTVDIKFTPTIPHCSMATLIGLCIRVKLLRSLPKRFKVTVRINPGTHASEVSINRQLNDKERVIAALENVHLLNVVNKCIKNGMKQS